MSTGCRSKRSNTFIPTTHQQRTIDYFVKSKYKGLLLYHKLGSGKTCTSIMIAERLLEMKSIKMVFVFIPGSLRKGWIDEYCKKCGTSSAILKTHFVFITYNYDIGKLPNMDNSLIIIDEVHNLINAVKNESRNAVIIYNAINNSKCKILALSGTPLFHYIYEWSLLGNMLKPNTFKTNLGDAFMKYYFNVKPSGELVPKDPVKFKKDMQGIISYYPGSGTEYYPDVEYMDPIEVYMPYDQEISYWQAVELENKLQKPDEELKQTNPEKYNIFSRLYIVARKNILSRAAGNFYYPKDIRKVKDALVSDGGWVEKSKLEGNKLNTLYSPKFAAFFTNLTKYPNQKHVLFTFFKYKFGVNLIHSMLKMCGIKSAIFSGDVNDSRRASILDRFNHENNTRGEKIKLLLITDAGSEGITILDARHIHILESSTRPNKIQQVIGRVVRYKSHERLPVQDRNVKVWRYWSIPSPEPILVPLETRLPNGKIEIVQKLITKKTSKDKRLFEEGEKTLIESRSFLSYLQKYSV